MALLKCSISLCNPDCPVQTPNRASGPNGKKWPKNGLWPTGQGKNGRKMGKLAQKWVKHGHFPIFWPFFPLLAGGAKIHFSAIFSHFGRRPDLGSVQISLEVSIPEREILIFFVLFGLLGIFAPRHPDVSHGPLGDHRGLQQNL